ncbi:hypothetical protein SF23_08405, partial [Streptomyces sp. MBRL 10]
MSTVVKGASAAAAAGVVAVFAVTFLKAPGERPTLPFPTVGVLMAGGEHWCTASVVDSPRGNVVATAAHCVAPAGED